MEGNANLIIQQSGYFIFTGHFHDSGIPPYDVALVLAISTATGQVLTWTKSLSLGGTLAVVTDGTSRDVDWTISGTNAQITLLWDQLQGATLTWKADVNLDLASVVSDVITTVKTLIPVVSTIISVV